MHHCKARHVGSELVIDLFRGEVAWDGVVETFDIDGHPKANAATLGRSWKTASRNTRPFWKFRRSIRQKAPLKLRLRQKAKARAISMRPKSKALLA